jgi:tetratricopeptide (TPR) repeat protein
MQKKYQFDDFEDGDAWIFFRVDAVTKDKALDVYVLMDLPSGMVFAYQATETELSQKQVDSLFEQALLQAGEAPKEILLACNDPAEPFLRKTALRSRTKIKTVPKICLQDLMNEVEKSFADHFNLPVIGTRHDFEDEDDKADYESIKQSIPDSYDLCSCASGLKYKFCCKRIFGEIVEAMNAAEDGDYDEALKWIARARKIVGNTSELFCREAIVYRFFDLKKSKECLEKCQAINPKHPRFHYIQAIDLTTKGDFEGAVEAYKRAISYYPETDLYHLNEAHNNLGVLYYKMNDLVKAKFEWEVALKLFPSDKLSKRNLRDLIYSKEKAICR